MDQIVPYPRHLNDDYLDSLPPGYRFCPTDLEIIVYYLKERIARREHPPCRLYEVDIYNHDPEELAELYRPCDDKWYFLTPRQKKYPKGNKPNRISKNSGTWKASQKYTTVYDDVNGGGLAVGTKTSLAYFDEKEGKTEWLMHEYAIDDHKSTVESNDDKVLDLVLCKIYKTNRKDNKRNHKERNQLDNEHPPRRQRTSMDQDDNVLQQPIQTQDPLQGSDVTSMQPMTTSHDSAVLPQYVQNPNNNEDILAWMDEPSPFQSMTTHDDYFSILDELLDDPNLYISYEEVFGPL